MGFNLTLRNRPVGMFSSPSASIRTALRSTSLSMNELKVDWSELDNDLNNVPAYDVASPSLTNC